MEHWAKLVNKILWVTAKSIIMKQCVKNLIKVLTCSVPKEKEWLAKEVLDTLKFFLMDTLKLKKMNSIIYANILHFQPQKAILKSIVLVFLLYAQFS